MMDLRRKLHKLKVIIFKLRCVSVSLAVFVLLFSIVVYAFCCSLFFPCTLFFHCAHSTVFPERTVFKPFFFLVFFVLFCRMFACLHSCGSSSVIKQANDDQVVCRCLFFARWQLFIVMFCAFSTFPAHFVVKCPEGKALAEQSKNYQRKSSTFPRHACM